MYPKRFQDNGLSKYSYTTRILVKCPRCSALAQIVTADLHKISSDRKLVCTHCGLNKLKSSPGYGFSYKPVDPFFGELLWLQVNCCGKTLWFFNYEHMFKVKSYVEASLRENLRFSHGWSNRSMVSRLPNWVKSAKNRNNVLKAISNLEKSGKISLS